MARAKLKIAFVKNRKKEVFVRFSRTRKLLQSEGYTRMAGPKTMLMNLIKDIKSGNYVIKDET